MASTPHPCGTSGVLLTRAVLAVYYSPVRQQWYATHPCGNSGMLPTRAVLAVYVSRAVLAVYSPVRCQRCPSTRAVSTMSVNPCGNSAVQPVWCTASGAQPAVCFPLRNVDDSGSNITYGININSFSKKLRSAPHQGPITREFLRELIFNHRAGIAFSPRK